MTQEILVKVFVQGLYTKAIAYFDDIVYRTREIIRKGRSNPRNKKPKIAYSMAYKRL